MRFARRYVRLPSGLLVPFLGWRHRAAIGAPLPVVAGGALVDWAEAKEYPRPPFLTNPSTSNTRIDAVGEYIAFLFQAPRNPSNLDIVALWFRTGSSIPATGTLAGRLEAVGSDGHGAGTPVATGAEGTVSVTAGNTWYRVPLDTPFLPDEGEFYASKAIIPSASGLQVDMQRIPTGSHNPYVSQNTGAGAGFQQSQGQFAIEYTGGVFLPIPASCLLVPATLNFNTGSTPDEVGNLVPIPQRSLCVGGYVHINTLQNFEVRLYDPDGSTVLRKIVVDRDVATAAGNRAHWPFRWPASEGGAIELAPATYRLAVLPTTASNVTVTEGHSAPSSAALAQMGGGAGMKRTHRTNAGAWTDVDAERMPFGLLIAQYEEGAGAGGGAGARSALFGRVM